MSLPIAAETGGLVSSDLYNLRSIGTVRLSPDGARVAYTVTSNDGPGRPWSQVWVMQLANGAAVRFGKDREPSSAPEWSPDGRSIAFSGKRGDESGLFVAKPDGSGARFLARLEWTNGPLPMTGKRHVWSPDGKSIAFVSSTPGPETADASGDPMVITRYLYKPEYEEGLTRFNDNRRTHLFLADVASGAIRQVTRGDFNEHSPDWSPDGRELLFVSNREPNQDQFFNYDVFALNAANNSIRRVTATESAEYLPQFSPDGKRILFLGTRRGLTDLETTMEDTHVWVMDADGSGRREIGKTIDNRQGDPGWTPDGQGVVFTVQERGDVKLCRLPAGGGAPEWLASERGRVGDWAMAGNTIAYAFSGLADMSQLFAAAAGGPPRRLTALNDAILKDRRIAPVESFTFLSNDNKYEVEAFLTRPLGMTPESKHPLIVSIHGGPHGQNGAAFAFKNQVLAGLGWATLQVNYRGSTGYGQQFADAVFADQNGNEAQDVLYGTSAALRRCLWIDRGRLGIEGGSYGGQLTAWLVTQTSLFKAAIPIAAIVNLVSYNYMTYYNQYEQMEWGVFPHQGGLMDTLWRRSALRYAANVKTPVMLMHGENDSDVPIAEAEQFYIALKDAGVETVMVRYPREGHGLREPKHVVDSIDRSAAWYRKHFR